MPFADADDFHPAANVAKMSAGVPLDDLDRLPWLHILGSWQAEHATTGAVVTCSALRRWYRDVLREAALHSCSPRPRPRLPRRAPGS